MKLLERVFSNLSLDTVSLTTFKGCYTANQLLHRVKKYEHLLTPLNISGKRVALLVPSIEEFIPLVHTINHLDGTVIPLNGQFRQADLTNVLNLTNPHIIFSVVHYSGFNFLKLIKEWASEKKGHTVFFTSTDCVDWETSVVDGNEKLVEVDLKKSYIFCTSGSTGTPKGLVFDDQSFDYSFRHISEFFELKAADTVMIYTSTSTIFGVLAMNIVIHGGAHAIIPNEFDLQKIIGLMSEKKCNKIVTTPSILKAIYSFSKQLKPDVMEHIELVCLIGEYIPENFTASFPLLKNARFNSQYGSSETGAIANANLLNTDEYELVDGAESKVVDGELYVKTGALFTEYYNSPELTDKVFENGWYKTGDLVEFVNETTFKIIGRKKDLIKKGGQQVIPSEVELVISSLEGVKRVCVLGAPHNVYGEQVIAFIVANKLTSIDIRSHCKGKIAAYKIPDKVVFIKELPIRQGKVDKIALKSMFNYLREEK
ncbi:class I adenylate-forming enzyme family protein [Lysinibacillus telephonicus]|uniref:Long-chain fatty acid--CoA ligase n=1 Tax=Lysinibacillus telephonicus TaxID=1714840 RepID=A0A431UIS4_9BACI|nr:class I adenylate-forming enzyme family protein [Lysinibacillus telephonicus]RTQ89282.1 long-chain fatty acid--CoA ligase [Lysinibacillus telephonicus]